MVLRKFVAGFLFACFLLALVCMTGCYAKNNAPVEIEKKPPDCEKLVENWDFESAVQLCVDVIIRDIDCYCTYENTKRTHKCGYCYYPAISGFSDISDYIVFLRNESSCERGFGLDYIDFSEKKYKIVELNEEQYKNRVVDQNELVIYMMNMTYRDISLEEDNSRVAVDFIISIGLGYKSFMHPCMYKVTMLNEKSSETGDGWIVTSIYYLGQH